MMLLLLVTLASMLLAVIMSLVAWRIAGDERRRSEARIAALAADIHGVETVVPRGPSDDLELRPLSRASTGAELFTAAQPRSGSQWPAVLGAGVFVLATAAALVIVLSGGSSGTTHASNQALAVAPPPVAALPLELVALGHERDGDRLTVRGIVRNPESGAAVDRLTAVVFLFNRDGGFLSSGRVAVEPSALRPGTESNFVVTIPGADDVGRYRVSFRTDDRIVPHVDRRSAQAKL
jgi:flagellar basal body-associated protein FliL